MSRFTSAATLFIFLLCASASAAAYNITGTVVDSDSQPLPDASARLLRSDSTFVKGTAADLDGNFTLAGIADGRYIVETSYVGYARAFTNVRVKGANVSIGKIAMSEASHLLAEATVTAVKTPIKVMEDTIEFNADSYKTQPNAVVEDLLKRLPGVEVDADGKITSNGKEVSKILIDGKEFFADDPKVASKNLPVSMVDKLQVVDRKSDLARITGVDDGEDETVINLTVKKGMQNGWFGVAEAGYGTDDRYKGSFNLNRFFNGNQITLLGNANNINELGFTDSNGQRFRRFGGDQGITDSQSLGLNFNVGREEIIRVGGDLMYSHSDKHAVTRRNRQYLLPDNPYTELSNTDSRDKGHNLRADFRVEWKPDSFNTLDVSPFFSYNCNDSRKEQFSAAKGMSTSLNRAVSDGSSWEGGARLIYNYNFAAHRGRSISVMGNYRFSNVREHDDSYVYNIFHQLDNEVDAYDQYTDNHTWANRLNTRLTWTEPIGNVANGNFLTLGYALRYNWNNADKLVYDRPLDYSAAEEDALYWHYLLGGERYELPVPSVGIDDTTLVPDLSNRFRNTTFQQDFSLGYKKVSRSLTLNAGISLIPILSKSENLLDNAKSIPSRRVWNWSPNVRLRYKRSKNTTFNADYFGRSSQPSMTQLQPVADYSDPLDVVIGNPELVPAFNHNVRLRFQSFDPDAQRSVMTMLFGSLTQNSIVSKTLYDTTTGARTTTYENVNGVASARLMNMFSQPLRNKAFQINNHIFVSYSRQIGFSQADRNVSNDISIAESFSLAFRPDNLELELRPMYHFTSTHNSLSSLESSNVHRYGGSFNATWYAPLGFILATDFTYTGTRGYADGFNTDTWMWNASLSYQMLRDRSLTLQLKVYDILGQKTDISRSVTAGYIDNTEYNALTRYFMLSLSYRFNTFGKGNRPQSRDMEGRYGGPGHGPGGPGGPGGRRPF